MGKRRRTSSGFRTAAEGDGGAECGERNTQRQRHPGDKQKKKREMDDDKKRRRRRKRATENSNKREKKSLPKKDIADGSLFQKHRCMFSQAAKICTV